jgi:hypothetical protein
VPSLPAINGLIDLILLDGEVFHSRVEDLDGIRFTVGAPYGIHAADVPPVGTAMEIAWVDGDRRHGVDVRLRAFTKEQPPRWELQVVGSVHLQTRRNYVRGGGGESAKIVRAAESLEAKVIDLSEGGVRLRITEDLFERDDRLELVLSLGHDRVPLNGRVRFVRQLPDAEGFDLIITYEVPEGVSRLIRGYVLRRDMEARRRYRDSVMNA